MSNDYTISHENDITKVQFFIQPTLDLAKQIIDEIVDKYPYDKRLWDISNIKFDFTLAEIKIIVEYGKLKFKSPSKIALFLLMIWLSGKCVSLVFIEKRTRYCCGFFVMNRKPLTGYIHECHYILLTPLFSGINLVFKNFSLFNNRDNITNLKCQ